MINTDRALIDFKMPADNKEICAVMDEFSKRYSFAAINNIGESVLSKNIFSVTLGDSATDKAVMYIGGIKAVDRASTAALLRFINEYCEYYKNGDTVFGINIRKLYNNVSIIVIPNLNPDGSELILRGFDQTSLLYERWRKSGIGSKNWVGNARGIPLETNFREWDISYPESESGALMNYIRFNSRIKNIIEISSGEGELVCQPEYANTRNANLLKKLTGLKVSCVAEEGSLCEWSELPTYSLKCHQKSCSAYYETYAAIRQALFLLPGTI